MTTSRTVPIPLRSRIARAWTWRLLSFAMSIAAIAATSHTRAGTCDAPTYGEHTCNACCLMGSCCWEARYYYCGGALASEGECTEDICTGWSWWGTSSECVPWTDDAEAVCDPAVPGVLEVCGNGVDDNCEGSIDEDCGPPDDKADAAGKRDEDWRFSSMPPDPSSCGETEGDDPILVRSRSAVTEPFVDFSVETLSRLAISRVYSSADVSVAAPNHNLSEPGIFGRGWHHEWESTITCYTSPTSGQVGEATVFCDVARGILAGMRFARWAWDASSLDGRTIEVYRRADLDSILDTGNQSILVRDPDQRTFVLFMADGRELHFATVCDSGDVTSDPNCKDAFAGGRARLVSVVDARGSAITVGYNRPGHILLSLSDDLGHVLEIRDDAANPGMAKEIRYDGIVYVTYSYGGDGKSLNSAIDADGNALASYDYDPTSPGRLLAVRNQAGDPVVEFGYSPAGEAISLVEPNGTMTLSYTESSNTTYRSASGSPSTRTSTRHRGGGGASFSSGLVMSSQIAAAKRRLQCYEDMVSGTVEYYDRDSTGRIVRHRRFASGSYHCSSSAAPTATAVFDEYFEYGAMKQLGSLSTGEPLNISLDKVTRSWRASNVANQSGIASSEVFEQTYDYDPEPKAGVSDPAGYACHPGDLPPNSVLCRYVESGLTWDITGTVIRERHATFYSYDSKGRLIRKIGPVTLDAPSSRELVPDEQRTYWAEGETLERRGRLKELSVFTAPDRNRVATTYDYSALGVYQVVDPNGVTSLFVRDARGRVAVVSLPGENTVEIRYYDGLKPRVQLLSSAGAPWEILARQTGYDRKGRVSSVTDWAGDPDASSPAPVLGWSERREHDAAGNTTRVTRTDDQGVIRWERVGTFDPRHMPVMETHPEDPSKSLSWTFALDGYLESITDEEAKTTEFVPDEQRRVKTVRRTAITSTGERLSRDLAAYTYVPGINAIAVVRDGAGRSTYYRHDDFGLVREIESPDTFKGGPVRFEHDARGNVIRRTYGRITETFEYDGLDRLTRRTAMNLHDGEVIAYSYSYDELLEGSAGAVGRLTRIIESDRTTSFLYDRAGQVRFEKVKENNVATELTTEYRYDSHGLLDTLVYPSGLQLKYERSPATKAVTEVRNLVSGTIYATGIEYLPNGPVKALVYGNGVTLSQAFNRRYEPHAMTANSAAGPILSLTYAMSPAGNPSSITDGVNTRTNGYDLLGRLTSSELPSGVPSSSLLFSYSGNRIVLAADAVTGVRRYAYAYDDQSNLSAISTYDPNGTSIVSTLCLKHDALNRLVLVGNAEPAAGGPDVPACRSEAEVVEPIARFKYDSRNRRVGRWSASTGRWTQYVLTADGSALAELDRPADTGGGWLVQREYVWLDRRPLAQLEHPGLADGGEGHAFYYHLDAIGLPRVITNANRDVVWRALTLPYGEVMEVTTRDPISGRTIVTNLRLPGQYDERLFAAAGLSGLQGPYYNWNRWYLPSLGKYLELDPWALAGGFNTGYGVDWYGYAFQNPLSWTDVFGLYPGQMPPLPPGYSWFTWQAIEFDTGWALRAPDGRLFLPHPEDAGHWRHWDIQKPGGGSGGRWPGNSLKPWPGQKKGFKKHQCSTDPSGDAPGWEPPPRNPLYEGGAPDAPLTPFLPLPGPVPMPSPFPMPGPMPVPVW